MTSGTTPDPSEILLKSIFTLSKNLKGIPFPVAVKISSGYSVIPFDNTNSYDNELAHALENSLQRFLETIKSSQPRFKGTRINDVGRKIEPQLVHELDKSPISVRQLGSAGYPDIEVTYKKKISYLEIKTSSVSGKSALRYFYYTGGKKVKADARHLLLTIFSTPDTPGFWKVENMSLSDLSRLKVSFRPEFNASKSDLGDEKAVIFSIQ